jgi:hypothetical protein
MASPIKIASWTEADVCSPIGALAASSTLLDGHAWDEVDNSANKFLDFELAGQVKVGNAPTGGVVEILVVAQIGHGSYPYPFTGSEADFSLPNRSSIDNAIVRAFVIEVDTTADGLYSFGPISVKSLFDGIMPKKFQVGLAHSTGDDLNAGVGFITVTGQFLNVG